MKRNIGLMLGLATMCASMNAQSNERLEKSTKMSIPKTTYKNKKKRKK